MCKAMNRSFFSVILGGFGADSSSVDDKNKKDQKPVKSGNAEDAFFNEKCSISYNSTRLWNGGSSSATCFREMVDKLKMILKFLMLFIQ